MPKRSTELSGLMLPEPGKMLKGCEFLVDVVIVTVAKRCNTTCAVTK